MHRTGWDRGWRRSRRVGRRLLAGLLIGASAATCGPAGAAADRPTNPKAVAPFTLVAEGSGPAGNYRVWAFRTSDGWACIEVDSMSSEGGGCDPAGGPATGGGVARNDRGVIVHGVTASATAVTAVVRDASGATIPVSLVEVGPALPGAKVGIADLAPAANPVAIDFLDARGAQVDSAPFP